MIGILTGVLVVVAIGWWGTIYLLAQRSIALCDIAAHGHLSGPTLARMAHEALGRTGATKYKQPYTVQTPDLSPEK